jgi:putative intracellular protease/amidase
MPLAEGFNDMEFWGTYTALRAAGFHVDVAAPVKGPIGKGARAATADMALDDVDVSRYVGVVIAGGSSPERLAKIPKALEICRAFMDAGKPVGAICHGPLLLMKAGVLKDRVTTSLNWIKDECPDDWMSGLHGKYLDRAPVIDRNLITARNPGDIAVFNQAVIPALAAAAGRNPERTPGSLLVVYAQADTESKWWFANREMNMPEGVFRLLGMSMKALSDVELAALASNNALPRSNFDLLAVALNPGVTNNLKESAELRTLVAAAGKAGKKVIATEAAGKVLQDMGLGDGVRTASAAAPSDLICELVEATRQTAAGRLPAKETPPKFHGGRIRVITIEPGFDDALVAALRVQLAFGGFNQSSETDASGWQFREVKVAGEKKGWVTGQHGIPIAVDMTSAEAAGLADRTVKVGSGGVTLHPSASVAESAELVRLIEAARATGADEGAGPFGSAIAVQPGFDDEVVAAMRLLLMAQGRKVAVVGPEKGEVRGLNGMKVSATRTYAEELPLTPGAVIVAPGAIWPKKELDKSDAVRCAWLLARREAGATLVAFGFDSTRLSREPVFKGKAFSSSDQHGPSRKLGIGVSSPERAVWTDDRLLTAKGADCLADAWRLMPHPNRAEQTVDILGEFLWARAQGTAENALFTDSAGKEGGDRSCLLSSIGTSPGVLRNNLTSLRPDVAHSVQIKSLRLHTTTDSNCKIMMGYMGTDWRFAHEANADLAHWAGADRVVLFVPIRHGRGANPEDGANYFVSSYGGQTISVVEFRAGEMIHYEWYGGGSGKLDERVLMDLYPSCKDMKPGITEPIFKFEVFDGGRWKVSIKFDGRKGLPNGGAVDGDFDLVVTEKSDGAKPHSVSLAKENAFCLTAYNPGASSTGSDILLKLDPFDRATGKPLPSFDRSAGKKDVKLGDLPGVLSVITGGGTP